MMMQFHSHAGCYRAAVLVDLIRSGLTAAARPELAAGMQAYMKSTMPYLGVRRPEVRQLVRAAERRHPITGESELCAAVIGLWESAEFREQQYAATELLNTARTRRDPPAERLALLRRLMVQGAWWDHVDEISHRVGELLSAQAEAIRPELLAWSTGADPWLRRSSIICQLGFRDRTDLDLLSRTIEASSAETGFFLRKAIGWALRDYARTDPDWVRAFVAGHPLSPLSVREACKHLR